MTRLLDTISLITFAVIALVITFLDVIGALDGLGWLSKRVPVITLLAVGAVLTHLALRSWHSSRELRDALKESTGEIRDAVRGIVFRELDGAAHYFRYAAEGIANARESIDDVTWGQVDSPHVSADAARAYGVYRAAVAKTSSGRGARSAVAYREIVSLPDGHRLSSERLGRLKKLLTTEYPNYHLRYFEYSHDGTPPLLQFFVLDKKEVLVTVFSSTSFDNRYFAVGSSVFAEILNDYFEAAWNKGAILKDPDGIRADDLTRLESRYSSLE